ncbi:GH1 family beta-glucosidase [Paractinoplanes brasiliensis]|uniref:Beta-glucosidase n=1 Tax=Paractinoplanes brasiliensis TaxID=52695 RepID=A0A4R6K254_9ACTN|nr:GH1 family beta-glucosidase [Actinoplanes brasiliensis]TDO42221.1 beta-glucosidase [Actinoplanes brasiliensis]GID31912.1 beta-glucosidase [Actinoplanes brasiliensis]
MTLPRFPDGFVFGCSTASYQIEGAVHEDGRGPSVWDTFAHTPGKTLGGDTGDVACDHYHRYAEDVALLAGLGVGAYRLSIAWPRVQPTGAGEPNKAGLDFYDRLVDALLEKGIEPVPTLFHWDLPQALEDQGGWLSRDTSSRFADYAGVVAARLGDRVRRWITLNEPVVHMAQGYAYGTHAPGRTLMLEALPVAHHQLLGHGLAVRALRAAGATEVMLTNNCTPVRAADDSPAAAVYDAFHNRLFNDPVLLGSYPDFLAAALDGVVHEGDLEVIRTPIDALGVNYYNPTLVGAPAGESPLPFELLPIEGVPTTAFGWPVVPSGLTELLTGLRDTYGEALPPIYITENGCSTGEDTDDRFRIDYLDSHLRALHDAITAGVDVRGYFVWSLLDNFEWAEGYSQRFGLVHVDFDTLSRTPRASYHWLREALTE